MKKYYLSAAICFGVSAVSAGMLVGTDIKDKASEEKYVYETGQYAAVADSRYGVYGGILESLQEKYGDICGWINVADTKISYPIVQSKDNEYYIRRAYDGTADKNGSIILDYRLSKGINENRNIILYGHNMASGNMFAYMKNPKKFTDADIEIYSDGILSVYKPFAAYVEGGSKYVVTSFENEEEIQSYAHNAVKKTVVNFGTDIPDTPYILTMVTCENNLGLGDKRIIIHAVRTEQILQ